VSIAGLPAVALPAGPGAHGLPIGVQLAGRPGGEWAILRIASAAQTRAGNRGRGPGLPPA